MRATYDLSLPAIKRQVYFKILPLLVAMLLLGWLSGGIIPINWSLLALLLVQWQTRWITQGPSIILTLIILCIQSLFIAFAWGSLIWLLVREGQKLQTLRLGKEKIGQNTSSGVTLHFTMPEQRQDVARSTRGIAPLDDQNTTVFPLPQTYKPSLEKLLGNPFDTPSGFPLPEIAEEKPMAGHKEYFQLVELEKQTTTSDSTLEEQPTEQAQWISKNEEARERFSMLLEQPETSLHGQSSDDIVRSSEKRASPEKQPFFTERMAPDQEEITSIERNPFDVKQEVLDIFASSQPSSTLAKPGEKQNRIGLLADMITELTQIPEVADGEFIYGHPFEGPLPAIFQHDEELKRALLQQIAEEEHDLKKRQND